MTASEAPPLGLRERKKNKTRLSIREHAMRLFREQGYEETTVEQIAAAAEVSPTTYFRYFPTKESVVFDDDYDRKIAAAFEHQPLSLSPTSALGAALRAVTDGLTEAELTALHERNKLVRSVPDLRTAVSTHLEETFVDIRAIAARRGDVKPDDFAVQVFSGAMQGIWKTVYFQWGDRPLNTMVDMMIKAMNHAEQGLRVTA